MSHENLQEAVWEILTAVGEDPTRPGLRRTPQRVAEMYEEILAGYRADPADLSADVILDVAYDEMILVRDIEFFSMCEHHLLPFFGRAHVAYIPKDKLIGLSQIPRAVEMFSRRLQVQERMTEQIAEALTAVLQPKGLGVVIEGMHLCAAMRGVKQEQARLITSAMRGIFKSRPETRQEFLALLQK